MKKKIKKLKSQEPLFCLSSNFVQSLKHPKYTFSKNFSQIGIFFAILCHFFVFGKNGKILGFLTHGQNSGKNRNFKNSFHNFFYFALKYHVSKFQVDTIKIDENNTQRERAHARFINTEIMAIFRKRPICCYFSMKNLAKSLFTSRKLRKNTFRSNLVPYIHIKKQIGDIFSFFCLFMLDLGKFCPIILY